MGLKSQEGDIIFAHELCLKRHIVLPFAYLAITVGSLDGSRKQQPVLRSQRNNISCEGFPGKRLVFKTWNPNPEPHCVSSLSAGQVFI